MRKHSFKFECRKEQIVKLLAHGPMTYDQLYKACGFDPQKHIRAMTADGTMLIRKEPFGLNNNFNRNVYYTEAAPETVKEDINGWSDELRVLMGYTPMKPYFIEGRSMIFDDEEYFEKHQDEIRMQAPTVGTRKFGSLQASNGDLEMFSVGL